jgi:hypothetical protein
MNLPNPDQSKFIFNERRYPMVEEKSERRDFIKKAAYAVPMILTLKALPAFAAAGSGASRSSTKSRDSYKVDKETDQNQQPNGSTSGQTGS